MTSLTSLPLGVLSHILSFLTPSFPPSRELSWNASRQWPPFYDPPVTLSLSCAETLTVPLPTQLLSPANASPILAAAALHLLGSRVTYLTAWNTTGNLIPWLITFAPHVKALSLRNPREGKRKPAHFLPAPGKSHVLLDTMCRRSMDLFSTLSIHAHGLVVLDLVDLPFPRPSTMEDQFIAGLYATLESNTTTLRELALPVFDDLSISETALGMSTLKHLRVFTIHYWNKFHFSDKKFILTKPEPHSDPFIRMIRAVDGHADRSRNITTLSELRLINVSHMPPALALECSGVFSAITTLRASMYNPIRGIVHDFASPDSDFLRAFTNLQRLFLHPAPRIYHSQLAEQEYRSVYSSLQELHLCPAPWFTDVKGAMKEVDPPSIQGLPRMNTFFDMSDRNIRTLVLPYMHPERLQNVIAHCSSLEFLCLNIRHGNLHKLGDLFRKSDALKALQILYKEGEGGLSAEDWRNLSKVVPDSHRNLCQVGIDMSLRKDASFTCVESMIDCFVHMIETLGGGARSFTFRVNVNPRRVVTVLEGICRLLKSCIHYASALEALRIDLSVLAFSFRLEDRIHEMEVEGQITELENKLLREVRSLHVLDLGQSGVFPLRRRRRHYVEFLLM